MRRRSVASGLLAVTLALFAAGILGIFTTLDVERGTEEQSWTGFVFAFAFLAFAVSGFVVAFRTGNPLGWLLLGLATISTLGGTADSYAVVGLIEEPGSLPAAEVAAWLADFVISGAGLLFGVFVFVFLLFPTGELPRGRWRIVPWAAAVGGLVAQLNVAFAPGPLPGFPAEPNPFGSRTLGPILETAEPVGMLLILGSILASVASMIRRYRGSGAEQRQQMKWFGAAAGFLALVILSGPVWWTVAPSFGNIAWPLLFGTALAGIPISIAVSVLKYRLYDIDVVVNKTLVYLALTAILAGVYLGLIVLMQQVLPVSGRSDLVVAASTLAVAGLFQPMRTRVQEFIDRRFYRRKYDAAETLGEFSSHLRDQVDLESLNRELVAVVGRTMQPAYASIWLRTGEHA